MSRKSITEASKILGLNRGTLRKKITKIWPTLMIKIRTALISVFDKTGVLDLAKNLAKNEVQIISSGGTAKYLKENNIKVTEVSEYTGFNEIFDGRVKTLHPKIHAGILARGKSDESELKKLGQKN